MKKYTKFIILSIALLLISAIFFNSIYAYFTDGETTTNTFTIGKIKIELQEPNWTPPTNITPNEEIEKDPQVANIGRNEAFVYLEVHVPRQSIITAEPDGTRKELNYVDLFTYDINPGWEQVGEDIITNDNEVVRIYAYSTDGTCIPLAKDATTPTLFDEVVFTNVIEDQGLEETTQNIIINAYGIQTNNVNGDKTDNASVWEVIKNQQELKYDEAIEPNENQTVLLNGPNFSILLKSNFPNATTVKFIKEESKNAKISSTDAIDFSAAQDSSILGYQDGNTVYISSNSKILANENSSQMFNSFPKLTTIELTNFDTSNVIDMSYMFSFCPSLLELNVNNFNTSNVVNMNWIFGECSALKELNVSNFDTSNVTNMACMFAGCESLTSLNISNFDTSNVTNMGSMFQNCSRLTKLNVTNFNTSNVTTMIGMFADCPSLKELDLSNFDTSKVTDMSSIFNSCSNLSTLKVSKTTWIINEGTNTTDMWSYCKIQEPTHFL